MQFYGGKKKGRHSSESKKDNTPRPAEKAPEIPAKPAAKVPETPAKPPIKATDTQKRQASQYRSDNDTSYGAEPHFASDEYISREEKKASRNWLKRGAIILGVFVLLCVGAYAAFEIWIQPPPVELDGPNTPVVAPTDDPGNETPDPTLDVVAPDTVDGEGRRPGTYTFLIAGLDVEGNHTDTNIVGMLDTVEGKLNLVNIPRDTLINVGYNIKKMNQVYPAAVNNNKDGVQALRDAVEKLLGYKVDCYAIVDIMAVADIVNAIGGVNFDIPFDMDWDAPDQTPPLYIHIKAGYQLLDGENFVHAMRFRLSNDGSHSYVGGDIERIAFQQQLLMALAKQTLSLGNIPNLGKIYEVYEQQVETNVEVKHLGYFAQEFLKLSADNITFSTIPNKPDGYIYGVSYVIPYIDEWLAMINEKLNPFYEDITEQNIDMISFHGNSWRMTQGYIAGGEYSFLNAQA